MKRLIIGLVLAGVIANGFVFLAAAELQTVLQEAEQKQPKLSSDLSELIRTHKFSQTEASRFAKEQGLSLTAGLIRVVITTQPGTTREAADFITELGGKVEAVVDDLIRAMMPVERLANLAESKLVLWIKPPTPPAALVTSEGAAVINAQNWQNVYGLTGRGVRIGLIDTGFRGYSGLLGRELPAQVAVRSFRPDGDISASDHGTAVAEIIHDVAPGASLYFTNYNDEVGYSQAVNWLIQQGVQVVNSSAGFYCRGAQDGTGKINSYAREATNRGIVWVNSSGNAAKHHWSDSFKDSNQNKWHNFDGSIEVNELELSAGDFIYACLSWDDWPMSGQDYDFYLYDSSLNIVKSSVNLQSPSLPSPPFEEIFYQVPVSGRYWFAVKKYSASREPRMHMFVHFLQGGVGGCAAETALENQPQSESRLALLRQFRDQILGVSSFGQVLEAVYYRHSLEMAKILIFDSGLRYQALSLIDKAVPFLEALTGSTALEPVITTQLVRDFDQFANQLAAAASESLKSDIESIRNRLFLDRAVGSTASIYWGQLRVVEPPPRLILLNSPLKPLRYRNAERSLVNPSDSGDVITVGAVYYGDDSLEDYSSQGPTLDGRIKPDVMGPTRVCTATRGSCGAGGFAGTSGSAPHIAGAAALIRQLKPGATRLDLETFIRTRTVDILSLGPDNQSGWGRFNLGNAFVTSAPLYAIDLPVPGATVYGSVRVAGWAIHPDVGVGTGVDSIHIYLDAPAGQGQPVGAAVYGLDRPDVAIAFGSPRFRLSGWNFDLNTANLASGPHILYIYAHSSAIDWSVFTRSFNKAAVGPVLKYIDWPQSNAFVSGVVRITGWAIHPDALSGTGVDGVHLYLNGPAGQGQLIGITTYGLDRPDVANAFGGQRFRFSGWYFDWNTASLSPGNHTLYVYTHSVLNDWSYFTWPIRK